MVRRAVLDAFMICVTGSVGMHPIAALAVSEQRGAAAGQEETVLKIRLKTGGLTTAAPKENKKKRRRSSTEVSACARLPFCVRSVPDPCFCFVAHSRLAMTILSPSGQPFMWESCAVGVMWYDSQQNLSFENPD